MLNTEIALRRLEMECVDRRGETERLRGALEAEAARGDRESQDLRGLIEKETRDRIEGDDRLRDHFG